MDILLINPGLVYWIINKNHFLTLKYLPNFIFTKSALIFLVNKGNNMQF